MRTRLAQSIAATPEALWNVVADPQHLPRWWPRVTRVENVGEGSWTTVLGTGKGRGVRADYRLLEWDEPRLLRFGQDLVGSPFERLMTRHETTLTLDPDDTGGTLVGLEINQKLKGTARFGAFMVRRAARSQLAEALEGLDRICGR